MEDANVISKDAIYESAAAIGQSFCSLAERFGVASVQGPMQRVISVLEQLETLATRNEAQDSALAQLQRSADALQEEKARHAAEEKADQEEREKHEEAWNRDSQQLLGTLAKLQEDNGRLKKDIAASNHDKCPAPESSTEVDLALVVAQLNQIAAEQRSRIRELQRDNREKTIAIESAKQRVRCLEEDNAVLRLVEVSCTAQTQRLEEQKRQLEQELAEAAQLTPLPPQDAADAADVCPTLPSPEPRPARSRVDLSSALNSAAAKVDPCAAGDAGGEVPSGFSAANVSSVTAEQKTHDRAHSRPVSASFALFASGGASVEHEPRFTEKELRTLYAERTSLRARLTEVQAELARAKAATSGVDWSTEVASLSSSLASAVEDDDAIDAPVQGPINQEPWEKLRPIESGRKKKKKPSKILAFFKMLGSSPGRSSSPRGFENAADELV